MSKKSINEIFTPVKHVLELVRELPEDVWKIGKNFIDPACGDGNMLVVICKLKIVKGHTPTQALSSVYGIEIVERNVKKCKERLLKLCGDTPEHRKIIDNNIVHGNTLKDFDSLWNSKGVKRIQTSSEKSQIIIEKEKESKKKEKINKPVKKIKPLKEDKKAKPKGRIESVKGNQLDLWFK